MSRRFELCESKELAKCFADIIDNPDKDVSDVTFRVGEKRFGGLRKLLACRCAVFSAMFSTGFKEASSVEEVCLPQFSGMADSFRAFLLYVHSGQTSLEVLPFDLYHIAEYFGMMDLKRACEDFVSDEPPSVENALDLIMFAHAANNTILHARVWEYACSHAQMVFADVKQVAKTLPQALLEALFKTDQINISETILFQILLVLPFTQQQALLPFVRLSLISPADILGIVAPSELIAKDDLIKLLAYRADPEHVDPPSGHITKKRKLLPLKGDSITLPVCISSDLETRKEVRIGTANTVAELKERCCQLFGLRECQVRIWDFFNNSIHLPLEAKLQEQLMHKSVCVRDGNAIMLEVL